MHLCYLKCRWLNVRIEEKSRRVSKYVEPAHEHLVCIILQLLNQKLDMKISIQDVMENARKHSITFIDSAKLKLKITVKSKHIIRGGFTSYFHTAHPLQKPPVCNSKHTDVCFTVLSLVTSLVSRYANDGIQKHTCALWMTDGGTTKTPGWIRHEPFKKPSLSLVSYYRKTLFGGFSQNTKQKHEYFISYIFLSLVIWAPWRWWNPK